MTLLTKTLVLTVFVHLNDLMSVSNTFMSNITVIPLKKSDKSKRARVVAYAYF